MSSLWDDGADDDAPICPTCGVSALPAESPGGEPVCENADCESFGEVL